MKYTYDPSGNLIRRGTFGGQTPKIVGQPVKCVVEPGAIASFSVVVDDLRMVRFQWRRNGADIPGATKDTLLLTNVSAANEGEYTVVVRKLSRSVTSKPAALMLDSDLDGLPDSWEKTNFGVNLTAQSSEGDKDKDGVSNLNEFLDGTSPNVKTSLRPRLVAYSDDGGSVLVAPLRLSYSSGETVRLVATPSAPSLFVGWAGDLTGSDNPATITMDKNKTVRARFASSVPPPQGLLATWRGETDANDLIGGNHGTFQVGENVTAPSVTAEGKVGGAFNFDGQVHVRVPDSAALKPAQFTIEMWVFPNVAVPGSTIQTLIARASTRNWNAWLLELTSGIFFFHSQMASGRDTAHTSPSAIPAVPLNKWTHLAASFDGATKRLYVNGLEAAAKGVQSGIRYEVATLPVIIGANVSNNSTIHAPFRGLIDEVCLYNRALTADEIYTIWNADRAGKNFTQPYFTSPSQLPDAALGANYMQQVTTILGTAPVSFSLSAGMLPPGMTLSSAGVVSGVSSAPGIFDFNVRATDVAGMSAEQLCLLQVF